jgi:hypothetical protein
VRGQRQVEERPRIARLGVEIGPAIPVGHADVVLLGAQADLGERLRGRDLVVAPAAGQLAGDPGVRGLADADDAVAIVMEQHGPLTYHVGGDLSARLPDCGA